MPQTSPMNWMTISLIMMIFMNIIFSTKMIEKMKKQTKKMKEDKKLMKWTW